MLDKSHLWTSGQIGHITVFTAFHSKTGAKSVTVDTPLPQLVTFEVSYLDSEPLVDFDRASGLVRFTFDNGVANYWACDQRGTIVLLKLLTWTEKEVASEPPQTVTNNVTVNFDATEVIEKIRAVVAEEFARLTARLSRNS